MALPEPSLTCQGACWERHSILQGVERPADAQGTAFWLGLQVPLDTWALTHMRGCTH